MLSLKFVAPVRCDLVKSKGYFYPVYWCLTIHKCNKNKILSWCGLVVCEEVWLFRHESLGGVVDLFPWPWIWATGEPRWKRLIVEPLSRANKSFNFLDIWSFLRCKVTQLTGSFHPISWVTWPECSILIGLSCAVVYNYMMQAMCFCWLGCFVHFLILVSYLSQMVRMCLTKNCLSIWLWDLLLIICFVYLHFYSEKTCHNWKPISYCGDLQPSCVHTYLIRYACVTRKRSIGGSNHQF